MFPEFRVLVYGDFILGQKPIQLPDGKEVNPALDADHLGPGLPLRCPTGDWVKGAPSAAGSQSERTFSS